MTSAEKSTRHSFFCRRARHFPRSFARGALAGMLLLCAQAPAHLFASPATVSTDMQKPSISAEAAVARLKAGNERFVSGRMTRPHATAARRAETARGQQPFAIVLSCSDSRVPPELAFDQGIGDLFVIRTAGHLADPGAIASIEYAIEHLGPSVLMIMGHESCGAVKAAATTPAGTSAGSPDLDLLVRAIRAHLPATGVNPQEPGLRSAVESHVTGVAQDLIARSRIIRTAVAEGRLLLTEAIYALESGQVQFTSHEHPLTTELTLTEHADTPPQAAQVSQ